ncbi:MAG: hypothetical protein V3T05_11535 [Myxococcota bacterium]
MSLSYRARPSIGFLLLVAVAGGTAVFFSWGLRTPPLDEVGRMDIELALGSRPALTGTERDLLQAALVRHAALGAFLIEDKHAGIFSANEDGYVEGKYAYLVRLSADDPAHLAVSYAGTRGYGAVSVHVRTATAKTRGETTSKAPFVWELPSAGPFPQLVEILLAKARGERNEKKRRHPVRIDLGGAP